LRDPQAVERLRAWRPDVLVVAAFGQILRPSVLDLALWGSLNVHASLLPRWRGAAPIQHAIRAGDAETGVTIMRMDAGLDTGPILLQRGIPIAPDETGASLHDRLAVLGAELLREALPPYLAGVLQPRPQPDEGVTYAPTLKKEDGRIDWAQPAFEIDRQVRAYTPWPGTFTFWEGQVFKVLHGAVLPQQDTPASPGALLLVGVDPAVQTGLGLYRLDMVQPAGKKAMTGQAFLTGHRQAIGSILGAAGELA
jgi:methionyl-tRNA formyltransferase